MQPEFLKELPIDRATGEPLRYRLHEGRPLLYSVGSDGVDDQGRDATEMIDPNIPEAADYAPRERISGFSDTSAPGDWVLWPVPLDIPPPEDEPTDDFVEELGE